MKYLNLLWAILLVANAKNVSAQNRTVSVGSPDRKLALNVFTEKKKLVYSIKAGDDEIIKTSPLGLIADSTDLGSNAKIAGAPVYSKVSEDYPIMGNHTIAHN